MSSPSLGLQMYNSFGKYQKKIETTSSAKQRNRPDLAALFSADKTKMFCCRGLHTHAGDINSHDIGKALPHLGDIRSQLRSLESDGDIHIGNAPAFRADHGHDLGQQNLAVNPLPFRGSVREKMSY